MTVIREETSNDAATIYAVHAESFPTIDEARLVDLLRTAGRLSVSLVAEATARSSATSRSAR
jgi:putative acetyltransferase